MKKTLYYFLAIIIANVLFLRFSFSQEIDRIVAFFAILSLLYVLPKLSTSLSREFIQRDFSVSESNSTVDSVLKNQQRKATFITSVILILLVGFHVWGYWNYMKYQNEDLSNKGIYTPAIVTDKKLETMSKHFKGYYIYYTYRYNGQKYHHHCPNDTIEVGDTIVVKFSPNNPDHHILMGKKF